jgi:malate dehydrogenase (oxaloacetate-decarboxylating)
VLPISNPTSKAEAMPADVLAWSYGTALVAAGISVAPAEYGGTTHTFGQANNFLVFPGLGLGVKAAGAARVTKAMLAAAARAVASQVDVSAAGAPILPDVASLRELSAVVAQAVCAAAISDGVATEKHDDVSKAIRQIMWIPAYRRVTS